MRSSRLAAIVAVTCWVLLAGAPLEAGSAPGGAMFDVLLQDARIQNALRQIRDEDRLRLDQQIQIAQIPAPAMKEADRAAHYAQQLRALGLADVSIDAEGNVLALRPGRAHRPLLVLAAHLDTVFPQGTDVTVSESHGRYSGRGLSDDALGLAVNLAVLRALQRQHIATRGDILFVATVGEEGLSNLRGVKALFRSHPHIDGFISIDGLARPGAPASIVTQATGSRRWRIVFDGPGGHSFENFGLPSATQAMGRAIAHISDLRTSAEPRTTFTVGVVSGGTAVNAIAAHAEMQVDLRSNDSAALSDLEMRCMGAVDTGAAEENARWTSTALHVSRELLSDRPAGSASNDAPIVKVAVGARIALGEPPPLLVAASTDSNVPIGLKIPAVTLEGGGVGDKAHGPNEWYEPTRAWLGPQSVLLTVLGLVGVEGLRTPLLETRGM